MTDVARLAQVSAQTVSRVLRDPDCVLPETRDRIMDAVRQLNYVPHLAASHLASNKSLLIGAVIPSLNASVFSETIQGLSEVLVPAGYQLLLGHTEYSLEAEEALVRTLLSRRPDGIFIAGTRHTRAAASLLRHAGVPVVESWDWPEHPIDALVGYSNHDAAFAMMQHLHAQGYRHIAFAGVVNRGDHRARQRELGYRRGVRELGLDQPRSVTLQGRPLAMRTGREVLRETLQRYPDTDALFFSSDVFAAGAILGAPHLGLSLPGDLAVAGFGDFDIAAQLTPSLTTVAVPAASIGIRAGELLLARLQGRADLPTRIDVGYTIVARDSTPPRPAGARARKTRNAP